MNRFKVLTNKSYIKKFQKLIKKTIIKTNDYLKNPSEKNIHDIRIAIRRLDTAYMVLPKKNRSQPKLKNYMTQLKLFFKTNTEIRDLDIITAKLDRYFVNSSSSELIHTLASKRKIKIKNAQLIASKLRSIPLPVINEEDISESKLRKQFHKTILKLDTRIIHNIPIVLGDDKKIQELHRLRKDFKKFRYTIELTLKNKENINIINLKKIQDNLGGIHDSDIMLDYLKNLEMTDEIKHIIKQENIQRNLNYKSFVKVFLKQRHDLKKLIYVI